jgi:hypothetical protein
MSDNVLDDALRRMLPQLVIVLINRLGGEFVIPVAEIDGTHPYLMSFGAEGTEGEGRSLRFVVSKKQ